MTTAALALWANDRLCDDAYAVVSKEALRARSIVIPGRPPSISAPWIVRTVITRQRPFAKGFRRLESLRQLPADWDSYGASPVSEAAVKTAGCLLTELSFRFHAEVLSPRNIAPIADGGVQMEWSDRDGNALEIWIDEFGEIQSLRDRPFAEERFEEKQLPSIALALAEIESFAAA